MLLGCALFVSNALAFLLVPAYVLYINRFQIAPEDRAYGVVWTAVRGLSSARPPVVVGFAVSRESNRMFVSPVGRD